MLYFAKGSEKESISNAQLKEFIFLTLQKLGDRKKVLAVPPDFTRFHSQAGIITEFVYDYYHEKLVDVLPATGTHYPVNQKEREMMFGSVPANLFREHKWKQDLTTLGEVPSEYILSLIHISEPTRPY